MAENRETTHAGNVPEQQALPESGGEKKAAKTTSDEGKTFEAATVFMCVEDCFLKGVRYRRGEELTGKICPPWFTVKPKADTEDKNKK